MDTKVFDQFRALVYEKAGIALIDGKETLVSARLGKRMRALGLHDYQEYFNYARDHEAEGELTHLLNAICTNFTNFYREADHFELLEQVVGQWMSEGQRRFRIWSAASSTGER